MCVCEREREREREREKDTQSIHVVFGGLGSIQALCPSVLMGVGAGETYTTRLVAPLSLMDGRRTDAAQYVVGLIGLEALH